jgi:hypothetical protein
LVCFTLLSVILITDSRFTIFKDQSNLVASENSHEAYAYTVSPDNSELIIFINQDSPGIDYVSAPLTDVESFLSKNRPQQPFWKFWRDGV